MHDKGIVDRDTSQRSHIYTPTRSEDAIQGRLVDESGRQGVRGIGGAARAAGAVREEGRSGRDRRDPQRCSIGWSAATSLFGFGPAAADQRVWTAHRCPRGGSDALGPASRPRHPPFGGQMSATRVQDPGLTWSPSTSEADLEARARGPARNGWEGPAGAFHTFAGWGGRLRGKKWGRAHHAAVRTGRRTRPRRGPGGATGRR